MATSDDDEWDKSTSELQSEDSDDLYENRPNRWKGPSQTWRSITEEERLTHNALVRLGNQDLSLHLYNAWALKQRPPPEAADEGSSQEKVRLNFPIPKPDRSRLADSEAQDVDAETGQPVRDTPWAPPNNWTAWPLPTHLLPPDDFMKMGDDEDEVFTFRRPDDQTTRSRLEEVVSAATLRFAKERLRRRGISESAHRGDESIVKTEPSASENESQPSESGDHSEDDERMDIDQESEGRQNRKQKAPVRTFKPVVATDDDVSYDIIRPSTLRIIEKFENSLTILHNAQMTSAQNLGDSEESSSGSEDGQGEHERMPTGDEADGVVKKKSNRGRPRKYVQREGESEKDFLIRRGKALKGKYKFSPTEDDEEEVASSPRKRRLGRERRRDTMTEEREHRMHKRPRRSKPQDWKGVLGAAALAGFSPKVIARATQRCANMFGQPMQMHKIIETAASGVNGVETTTYQPGEETPSSRSDTEEDVDDLDLHQTRSMSRQSSAAPSRQVSPPSNEDEDQEATSPKKSQKRTTSRGKGQHYCPYTDCERAHAGFDRPFNLKRHMKLVHGQDTVGAVEKKEAATEDMIGGVHRDGFLQPIQVQKGWRAEDTKKRARRNS